MPNIPYEDLPLTSFPVTPDTFVSFLNVTAQDGPLVLQYLDAMNTGNVTLATQILAQIPSASQKIIRATDLNHMTQAILAVERFYQTDIEPYIDEKQQEWTNIINRFSYIGTWNSGTSYVQNNMVTYNAGGVTLLYIATASNVPVGTPPTNSTYWRVASVVGVQGESGPGLTFSEGWNSSTTYSPNSAVVYGGALWMSLQESTGVQPGTDDSYWRLVFSLSGVTYPITDIEPVGQENGGLWFNTQNNPTGYVRLDPLDNPAQANQILSTYEAYDDQGEVIEGTLDVYTKPEIDEKLADYLPLAGGTMTGAIAMSNQKITGLGAPTEDNDAVRKIDLDNVPTGAVIETLQIAAGNTISPGDVVDINSSNQVYKSVTAEANVENVFLRYGTDDVCVCKLNENYSVVASSSTSNGNGCNIISNSTGEVIGDIVEFGNYQTIDDPHLSLARLSDTQFVVAYVYGNLIYAKVGTVSGTSISFGTEFRPSSSNTDYNSLVTLDASRVALAYCANNSTRLTVLTVSGSTLGQGPESSIPGITDTSNLSATLLPDDSSGNHRVCVCFSDSGDGNKGKAVIATIDSANQVTWGSVVTFEEANTQYVSCCATSDVVIVHWRANSSGYAKVLSVSGNTITGQGTSINRGTGMYAEIAPVGSGAVMLWDATNNSSAAMLQLSGTALSVGGNFSFNTSGESTYISAAPISSSKFIVAYADAGNNSYGTTTILEVMGNQIAGSFTQNSSTAIALGSGVEGQNVQVIYSGITQADWIVRDQIINSSGVYGVGVTNGVLQVYGKNRPGQVVTGSYVGSGEYGEDHPNTLTFNKPPKCVVINGRGNANDMTIVLPYGCEGCETQSSGDSFIFASVTWSGNSVSWYANTGGDGTQANRDNMTYYYTAFF